MLKTIIKLEFIIFIFVWNKKIMDADPSTSVHKINLPTRRSPELSNKALALRLLTKSRNCRPILSVVYGMKLIRLNDPQQTVENPLLSLLVQVWKTACSVERIICVIQGLLLRMR